MTGGRNVAALIGRATPPTESDRDADSYRKTDKNAGQSAGKNAGKEAPKQPYKELRKKPSKRGRESVVTVA